ncbi:MAG: tetratricopeptide repeat protein [Gemmatimonadetes bacterium]|nr:tetratricopeptide repeat protein [Gemmatimonadota bacterium]
MKIVTARTGRAVALAAALLLSAGCATKRDLRDLRVELQALSARQDSILRVLARQNALTQDTLRRQTDQLFEIRGYVSRQLQRIMDEITTLRELTGQNQRSIAAVRELLEEMRPGGGAAPAGEAIVGVQPGGGGAGGAGTAEATYNVALQLYQRDQLATAQRAFQDFLQQYGNHALAPDTRFFLADILVQQEKFQEALDAFNKIPELHPTSSRVPDALYRGALLDIQLGKRDEGRRKLERVVNSYPQSNSAGPAGEKLRELR